ncbi:Uncharacterized membrane protein YkoI [Halobacillus dabanensis]|uniref:Uncharacterized membrane protein YkoI n=1 Tax=Halobacillus dabanensis TaxID=240302 RepID=A0A1I3RNL0_HALDA|nr:PepSY domain-containing protein [Halobacillus dabanensis]SFJ46847.1 Uncharacterized membrane protein YkoI [Halobacillus dabanensis]
MSKSMKLILTILVLVLLLVIGWQLVNEKLSAKPLSEEEVREKVQSQYNAQLTEWVAKEGYYSATMELEEGLYEIIVRKEDGSVADMRQVDDFSNGETSKETENLPESPAQPMSEEKAMEIALKEVDGKVDDIEFETENEIPFFLVEIERTDELEASVQVHAITGEILSINWED